MSYAPALSTAPARAWEHNDPFALPPCALAMLRAMVAALCVAELMWRGNRDFTAALLAGGLGLYGGWCAAIAAAICRGWLSASHCRALIRSLDVCAIALLALVDDPFGAPLFLLLCLGFAFASYGGRPDQAFTNSGVVFLMLAVRWAARPLAHPFAIAVLPAVRHFTVAHPLLIATAGTLFTWSQHRRRAAVDAASAAMRLIGSLRPELGARGVFRAALAELLHLAEARAAIVAVENRATRQVRLIVLCPPADADSDLEIRRIPRALRHAYLLGADPPCAEASDVRSPQRATVHVLASGSRRTPLPREFRATHPCRRIHAFAFRHDEWDGRIFLLDPSVRDRRRSVQFIRHLLEDLVPVVAGICDLHALRRRAAAAERARLGRELHDGIVQELFRIDLELELLRHDAHRDADVACGLQRVQERLHSELASLRRLMASARSHDVDPARLPEVLKDMVERFASDSGITAQFVCDGQPVELAADVCGQLTRIVQEALVNVRRHSRARHVWIRFACTGRTWRLSVQDDGCGFQTWQAVPALANRTTIRQPAVISERVRAIGGTLLLGDSAHGGARLEIASRI